MDPTRPSTPSDSTETPSRQAAPAQLPASPGSERVRFEGSERLPRLVFHALSSAVCAVVPVPFLDDHLVKLTRRRMTRELASAHGFDLGSRELVVLSGTEARGLGWGCFVGLLISLSVKIVVKILRRIFRTILFWLLVKDAANAASRTFHEGYLLDGMLRRAEQDKARAHGEPVIRAMRSHVEAVIDQVDTSALTGGFRMAMRGTRSALSSGARRLSSLIGLRREADDGAQRLEEEIADTIPGSWVERATAMLQREGDYLHRLDELLAEQVYRAKHPTPRPETDSPDTIPT